MEPIRKQHTLAALSVCLFWAVMATGCANQGLREDLFGHWHETMVLFRDYQNGNIVAADSTQDQLYTWRFKRDGNGMRSLGEAEERFKWTLDEEALEINLCTDQGLLSCVLHAYKAVDADHMTLIARYNETATTYTEGEYRLARGRE
jgi:hypothetical protein